MEQLKRSRDDPSDYFWLLFSTRASLITYIVDGILLISSIVSSHSRACNELNVFVFAWNYFDGKISVVARSIRPPKYKKNLWESDNLHDVFSIFVANQLFGEICETD